MIAAPDTQPVTISSASAGNAQRRVGIGGSGQGADLRYGMTCGVGQQRTHRANFRPGFEEIRELSDRVSGDSRVVVETEDVLALGGTEADVERFGEAEVFGKTAVAHPGELLVEGCGAVGRTAIDDDYLKGVAEHFEALTKLLDAVERNDYD